MSVTRIWLRVDVSFGHTDVNFQPNFGHWRLLTAKFLPLTLEIRQLLPPCLSTSNVKKHNKYFPVNVNESWRIASIKELIEVKSDMTTIGNFDDLDIHEMKDILSTTWTHWMSLFMVFLLIWLPVSSTSPNSTTVVPRLKHDMLWGTYLGAPRHITPWYAS